MGSIIAYNASTTFRVIYLLYWFFVIIKQNYFKAKKNEELKIDYNISCNGEDDGSIELTVSGGTPPYLYDWTGPNGFISLDENIFDLAPGNYSVLVTDSLDCVDSLSFDIEEPEDFIVTIDNVTNSSCLLLTYILLLSREF